MEDDENTSLQARYLDTYVETQVSLGSSYHHRTPTDSSRGQFRAEVQPKLCLPTKTGSISHFPGLSDRSILGEKKMDTVFPLSCGADPEVV